jgi:hypothetical protein
MADLAREHHALKKRLAPDGPPCPSSWLPTGEDILYAASWLQEVNRLTDTLFTKTDLENALAKHLKKKTPFSGADSVEKQETRAQTTDPRCLPPNGPTHLEQARILLDVLGIDR